MEIVPLFYLKSTFMEHNQYPEMVWQRQEPRSVAERQAPVELEAG